jgi:hypothetical protein
MEIQTLQSETTALALPIKGMEDVAMIGHAMAASGMFGLKNDAQGMVLAMTCIGEGITPVAFKRKYHVYDDGTLSMRADAMAAGFRARGGRYTIREHSTKRAAALFEFEGNKIEAEFTIADAERHGYTKGKDGIKHNWRNHPENMLWARLISENIRILAPEVCAGAYTPEEVMDFEERPARAEIPVNPEDAAKMVPIPAEAAAAPAKAKKPTKAAKPAATEPAPESTPFDDKKPVLTGPDYGICPMPPKVGEKWADMPTNVLKHAAKASHPAMEPGHYAAIAADLELRAKHLESAQ